MVHVQFGNLHHHCSGYSKELVCRIYELEKGNVTMEEDFRYIFQRLWAALWVFKHYDDCRIKDDNEIKRVMTRDVLCGLDLWNQEHNDILGEPATSLLKNNIRYCEPLSTEEYRYLYNTTLRAARDYGFRHYELMLRL